MSKKYMQLSVAAFQILLALSLKPRHGYEIMKQIDIDTNGRIKIGPGSLYGTINELVIGQLIQNADSESGTRRKYYELTESGKVALNIELANIEATLQLGRERTLPTSHACQLLA